MFLALISVSLLFSLVESRLPETQNLTRTRAIPATPPNPNALNYYFQSTIDCEKVWNDWVLHAGPATFTNRCGDSVITQDSDSWTLIKAEAPADYVQQLQVKRISGKDSAVQTAALETCETWLRTTTDGTFCSVNHHCVVCAGPNINALGLGINL